MTYDGRIEAQMTVPSGGSSISVTNSGGGPTVVTVPAGAYYLTSFTGFPGLLATLQSSLIAQRPPGAGTWSVTMSTGPSGTGKITIDCTDHVAWSITWTDTNLRDVLGFTANIPAVTTPQTGTKQCHGLFIPDCPLQLKGDPKRAPKGSDHRRSISPKGRVFGIVGTTYRRLREAQYMAVARGRVWEAEAAIANGSWETFYLETQLGQMSSWFTPSSLVQIYDHTGTLVGIDANSGNGLPGGWGLSNPTPLDELEQHIDQYTGLVKIVLGDLYSDG